MKPSKIAPVVFLGVLLFGSVPATTASDMPSVWANLQARKAYAHRLREEFVQLDAQIPTLSPAEEQWLKTEYDDEIARSGGRYTRRAVSATESREWQLRSSKPRIKNIIRILDGIGGATPSDQKGEVRLWTELASAFVDTELWQCVKELVRLKIVDKKIGTIEGLYFENHALWAQRILDQVVLKYLNGQLVS